MPEEPITHKRILNFPGAVNLRDFGGIERTRRPLRVGLLYRSGMLAELTPLGQQQLRALGIGVICDLRRPQERDLEPTPFPIDDPRQVHIELDPDSGVLREALGDRKERMLGVQERIRFMIEINRELARVHTAEYRRVFEALNRRASRDSSCIVPPARTAPDLVLLRFNSRSVCRVRRSSRIIC